MMGLPQCATQVTDSPKYTVFHTAIRRFRRRSAFLSKKHVKCRHSLLPCQLPRDKKDCASVYDVHLVRALSSPRFPADLDPEQRKSTRKAKRESAALWVWVSSGTSRFILDFIPRSERMSHWGNWGTWVQLGPFSAQRTSVVPIFALLRFCIGRPISDFYFSWRRLS